MDERGKYLLGQLQFMERNVKALEEVVAKMLRIREEQENFNNVFAKSMHDIGAMEEAKSLAHCFNSLGDCGTTLVQDTHDIMIVRPEVEILQVLTQIQDWGVVPMKRLLDDREKTIKVEQKLQKEYDDKKSVSVKEKEKKLRMLSDQKRRVENVNLLIDQHLKSFESFRTERLKKVITEIARSQAFYHAKGLEVYAMPCAAVATINSPEYSDVQDIP